MKAAIMKLLGIKPKKPTVTIKSEGNTVMMSGGKCSGTVTINGQRVEL